MPVTLHVISTMLAKQHALLLPLLLLRRRRRRQSIAQTESAEGAIVAEGLAEKPLVFFILLFHCVHASSNFYTIVGMHRLT